MHLAFAALLLALPLAPQTRPATITVDARRSVGRFNPWVLGGNMVDYQVGAYGDDSPDSTDRGQGVWDPEGRKPVPEMVALMRKAGLSVARWPGGCGVHAYDWKKTIGPLDQRPRQRFGLPEFLRLCREARAVPLITLSDYTGTARDAADLVEYLNAPDDGRHPWAARRTADGSRAPWRVVWFEYGNESEHGLHFGQNDVGQHRRYTPREYAARYLEYRAAMRKVDPKIKLGAVVTTGFPPFEAWALPAAKAIGSRMDFAIQHCYMPSYSSNDGKPAPAALLATALAAPPQIEDYYARMNAMLRGATGRSSTPVAVTEFNGGFVQQWPVPYRHTLGNALLVAEMLRVFAQPRSQVVMANFWMFANEYWGAVRGFRHRYQNLVLRPQYYPFAMYREHFGTELLEAKVECGTFETPGGFGVLPARGTGSQFRLHALVLRPATDWSVAPVEGVVQRLEGSTVEATFGGTSDVNYFHARVTLPVQPGRTYRLTGWVKAEALTSSSGACFQLGDARGWVATQSAILTPDVRGTADWTKVEADYTALPDTRAVEILARRNSGGGAVTGRAWYRDVSLREMTPRTFPAVPVLSVNASRSDDGRSVTLMVTNKRLDGPVTAAVRVRGMRPATARAWALQGPSVDSTNERAPGSVTVKPLAATVEGGIVNVVLPPHSFTALVVTTR